MERRGASEALSALAFDILGLQRRICGDGVFGWKGQQTVSRSVLTMTRGEEGNASNVLIMRMMLAP